MENKSNRNSFPFPKIDWNFVEDVSKPNSFLSLKEES